MNMKRILPLLLVIIALALAVVGGAASSAQDKHDRYTLQVPGGLAFSVPHAGSVEGLHFHDVPEEVNPSRSLQVLICLC
jgi:hypothetical protein